MAETTEHQRHLLYATPVTRMGWRQRGMTRQGRLLALHAADMTPTFHNPPRRWSSWLGVGATLALSLGVAAYAVAMVM